MIFMLNKLALRNARRLWKDYLNYFLTLCMITALTFFLSFFAVFKGYLRNDSFWKQWGAFYGRNNVSYIYGSFHSGNPYDCCMADKLYDTFYFRKKKPGICDLLIIGNEEKADCSPLHERKFLSWNIRSFAGLLLGSGLQQILFYVFIKVSGKITG